jgi:hypothetical protein
LDDNHATTKKIRCENANPAAPIAGAANPGQPDERIAATQLQLHAQAMIVLQETRDKRQEASA